MVLVEGTGYAETKEYFQSAKDEGLVSLTETDKSDGHFCSDEIHGQDETVQEVMSGWMDGSTSGYWCRHHIAEPKTISARIHQ